MKKLTIITLLILNISAISQINADSVKYDFSYQFKDGLYLNFEQLKDNQPIDFQRILNFSEIYNETEYFDTVTFFKFYDEFGILKEIDKTQIFGYCVGGKPYIYFVGKFNMLPSIGTISYFVATVMVMRYYGGDFSPFYGGFYDNYPSSRNYYRKEPELRQFLLDFKNGKVYEYNIKAVENLLQCDSELLEKYKKLSKRRKEKQKFDFIRQFNEKYPLYIISN